MRIAALNLYPVKALGGLPVETADVETRGLAGDRRAMVVDVNGRFVTQRELPSLATIRTAREGHGFCLVGPSGTVPLAPPEGGKRRMVTVWGDRVDALAGDRTTDAVLWRWLGEPVAIVHMDARSHRAVDTTWAAGNAEVSFADGFPLLLAGTASLAELNRRIAARGGKPVGMERFRPNVVVKTDEPFVEDRWEQIAIGGVRLDLVKPCTRCVVTTTDQETGAVAADKEPLSTLATFRRSGDRRTPGVLFGWNAVPAGPGRLSVGEGITVLRERDEPWPAR